MRNQGLAILLALATAAPAARGDIFPAYGNEWQLGRFNVAPFAGYRFGGEMEAVGGGQTVDLDGSPSYGVILGWSLTDPVRDAQGQAELIWSHQAASADLGSGRGAVDLDIDYFHLGGLYIWDKGAVAPFAGASAGITHIDPGAGSGSGDTVFSLGIGAGGRIRLTDHIGLRLEARGYATFLESDKTVYISSRGGAVIFSGSAQWQGDLIAGLVVSF